jgi:hypothetical protein
MRPDKSGLVSMTAFGRFTAQLGPHGFVHASGAHHFLDDPAHPALPANQADESDTRLTAPVVRKICGGLPWPE